MVKRIFNTTLAIFFPTRCIGCKKKGDAVCPRCVTLARKALSTPHPFIFSLFDFKEPIIRQAIHSIKYYHRRDLVHPLARALALEMKKIPDIESYILVPIPMPRMRKLMRGYNQAELIAARLGEELSLPVVHDILLRARSPGRQVKASSRATRLENQKGSFHGTLDLSGGRYILVDDVATTGATLKEARKALLSKKASDVLAVTLAH